MFENLTLSSMQQLLYLFFFIGSVSTGYSITRTGFPFSQSGKLLSKISAGYVFGILVFALPVALIMFAGINSDYFFVMAIIFYVVLLAAMYLKRTITGEADPQIIQESKKTPTYAPFPFADSPPAEQKPSLTSQPIAQNIPLRKSLYSSMPNGTQKKVTVDNGLYIKSKPLGQTATIKSSGADILKEVKGNTEAIDKKSTQDEKLMALKRLKSLAQQMSKKEEVIEEDGEDEDDDSFFNGMNEEQ